MESTRAYLDGRPFAPKVLPHPYAFNVFSHNSAIEPETGYNDEETKVITETRKIFGDEQIAIGATCVRVPVLRAHASRSRSSAKSRSPTHEVARSCQGAGRQARRRPREELFPDADRRLGPGRLLVGRIRGT